MDPLTAYALAIKALAELGTEMIRGQSVEQKNAFWQIWLENVKAIHDVFKVKS